jgi:hypothetical protein
LVLADAIQEHGSGQKIRRLTLFDALERSPDSGPTRKLITASVQYGLTTGGYSAEFLDRGSYGGALLIQSNYVPRYYAALIATGAPNSDANPVGFREHVNPAYQGLRHIPRNGPYPIQDSFYVRGFGVGTRHRGAAVATQITTDTSYTAPMTIAT